MDKPTPSPGERIIIHTDTEAIVTDFLEEIKLAKQN
jgi:hypothetical protein